MSLTTEETRLLEKSAMPKDLYLDLRKMYDGGEGDYVNELAEALEDEEKWKEFQAKNNIEYQPLAKAPGEIKDSGEVYKFHSAEEQDAWLKKMGLI